MSHSHPFPLPGSIRLLEAKVETPLFPSTGLSWAADSPIIRITEGQGSLEHDIKQSKRNQEMSSLCHSPAC